jgi:hypothetical protein
VHEDGDVEDLEAYEVEESLRIANLDGEELKVRAPTTL